MTEPDGNWLRLSEQSDVIASLSECLRSIRVIEEDLTAWKWAIISMHLAVQGAMVCHLSGSAGFGVLSDKSLKKTMEWHDRDRAGEIKCIESADEDGLPVRTLVNPEDAYPEAFLADPPTLFKRLTDDKKRFDRSGGKKIELSEDVNCAFGKLHDEFRNKFMHFCPKSWSIEMSGMPRILLQVLEIIDKIAADHYAFRHLDKDELQKLSDTLTELRTELTTLDQKMLG